MIVETNREQWEYYFAESQDIWGSKTGTSSQILIGVIEEFLEKKGKEGWELVSFNCANRHPSVWGDSICERPLLILKRKKQNDTKKV